MLTTVWAKREVLGSELDQLGLDPSISSAYIAYCNPPSSWNIQPTVIDMVNVTEASATHTIHTPGGWGSKQ